MATKVKNILGLVTMEQMLSIAQVSVVKFWFPASPRGLPIELVLSLPFPVETVDLAL